ncbi:DUF4339 domain-containing protein [Flavobacterium soyangense]|uniref:DUF4339 domain-containing protein n=1 Tax=Flavobacterium soyangense TaxID=2023265 RepID=A0A930U826_9FLAO|nr:DUF4339 domain-containing protein [Flavobacterium soyangense]MBF2708471.1 DUF4339 domain-containing protein [Flavobacterium soyangense]
MKKYFLHNGTENSGPYDLDELKTKSITKTTPVWYEGMKNWKYAGEIAELNTIFATVPPPISSFKTPPPTPKMEQKSSSHKIIGLPKTSFFVILTALVTLIGISVLNTMQENRSQELKLKNHKTEVENYQYELQQKEIANQKIIAAQEEKAAAERMLKEKKNAGNNRLLVIQQIIAEYQTQLKETEKKLNDVSGFKLLRTASEKKEQMNLLQKNIDSFKIETVKLKNESDQLKLELEKTQ